MKKLLAIMVLGLIWSSKTYANDFYLSKTTPLVLIEMGFKLFSTTTLPENDQYDVVYTFVKDNNIVSCKVKLEATRSHRPYFDHECYNITGFER